MPEISLSDWNEFLKNHPGAHLLQTGEWGLLKSAFGWQAVRVVQGTVGAQILFRTLPLGWKVAYIPRGPVWSGDSQTLPGRLLEEIETVCRNHRAIFCKLEPDAWEESQSRPDLSWSTSRYSIQPRRTIVVDLRGSEEDILSRMKQKTRYNIGLAAKKGVTVGAWDDLDGFYRMVRITGGRDGFGVHSLSYYRRVYDLFHSAGSCEILMAAYEGRPLAALMVFARDRRAWYFYGASTDEERNRMPTYLLQWQAMLWARARGCEEYDLWGVPDEDEAVLENNFTDRQDGLWGVYRFKRGFGGDLKRAAQPLDRVFQPFLYRIYLWRMAGRESG